MQLRLFVMGNMGLIKRLSSLWNLISDQIVPQVADWVPIPPLGVCNFILDPSG